MAMESMRKVHSPGHKLTCIHSFYRISQGSSGIFRWSSAGCPWCNAENTGKFPSNFGATSQHNKWTTLLVWIRSLHVCRGLYCNGKKKQHSTPRVKQWHNLLLTGGLFSSSDSGTRPLYTLSIRKLLSQLIVSCTVGTGRWFETTWKILPSLWKDLLIVDWTSNPSFRTFHQELTTLI